MAGWDARSPDIWTVQKRKGRLCSISSLKVSKQQKLTANHTFRFGSAAMKAWCFSPKELQFLSFEAHEHGTLVTYSTFAAIPDVTNSLGGRFLEQYIICNVWVAPYGVRLQQDYGHLVIWLSARDESVEWMLQLSGLDVMSNWKTESLRDIYRSLCCNPFLIIRRLR